MPLMESPALQEGRGVAYGQQMRDSPRGLCVS